jgi:hypothetical protein
MSSEKEFRKRVIKALKPLHAIAVENGCGLGCPDINYVNGWIECKSMDAWPARADTPLQIPHYSQDQRVFATIRTRAGGEVYFFLKVGNDFLLFDGLMAADLVGKPGGTQQMLWDNCLVGWEGHLEDSELLAVMRGDEVHLEHGK